MVSIITGIILLTVMVSMLPSIIVTGATATHNLSDGLAGQSATIGSAPASFAGNIDDYMGWFWVLGPFILVLTAVVGLFLGNKRR